MKEGCGTEVQRETQRKFWVLGKWNWNIKSTEPSIWGYQPGILVSPQPLLVHLGFRGEKG